MPASGAIGPIAIALCAFAQDPEVRELAIAAESPPPKVEVTAAGGGRLHLWAESDHLDPELRVLAADGTLLAHDDDGGGGTTAYATLAARAGASFSVEVLASEADAAGTAGLTVAWSLESQETRDAAAWGRSALEAATRRREQGAYDAARAELEPLVAELLALPGRERSAEVADLLRDAGVLALDLGAHGVARPCLQAALAHAERTHPAAHEDLLASRAELAELLALLGEKDAALDLRRRNVEVAERHRREADAELHFARMALARAHKERGELERALALEERAVAALERSVDDGHPRLAAARQDLAATLASLGRLESAYELERRILSSIGEEAPGEKRLLNSARYNHCATLLELGRIDEAQELLEVVLETYAQMHPEEHPSHVAALELLAVIHGERLDFPACRQLHERVLAIRERTLPPGGLSILMSRANVAFARKAMGDLEGAYALEQDVLRGFEALLDESEPRLAMARSNLAITLRRMGEIEEAHQLQERALAAITARLPRDHPSAVRTRLGLSASLQALGRYDESREQLEELLRELGAAESPDRVRILMARSELTVALSRTGETQLAVEQGQATCSEFERLLPASSPILLDCRLRLALDLAALGQEERARDEAALLAQGILARLLEAASRSPREARQVAAGGAARLATLIRWGWLELDTTFELAETRRWLAAGTLPGATVAGDERTAELRAELFAIRRTIQQLTSATSVTDAAGTAAALTRLALERDRLDADLRQHLVERGARLEPVRARDVARALGPRDVAVGYLRLPDTSREGYQRPELAHDVLVALVLRADGSLSSVELGTAGAIAEAIDAWRAALGAGIRRGQPVAEVASQERERGAALRALVLDPVLAQLPGDEPPRRLHVALDSLLHLVPLDALPLEGEAGETRVGDRMEVVVETSFERLAAPPRRPSDEPVLVAVGGPDFDARPQPDGGSEPASPPTSRRSGSREGFTPLLQARLEVETVATLFDECFEGESFALTRDEATKQRFLELAPQARWLHVATHGWFAPETLLSISDEERAGVASTVLSERVSGLAPMALCGLAFSGANLGRDELGRVPGILLAEELAAVDLSRCELAVLSACETNVGLRRAGEGIQSLQAGLHAAGAQSAITSLWKVDDAAARRLMELFYTALWHERLPRSQALWKAKRTLRAEGAPLRDWSGWVLTGDPGPR